MLMVEVMPNLVYFITGGKIRYPQNLMKFGHQGVLYLKKIRLENPISMDYYSKGQAQKSMNLVYQPFCFLNILVLLFFEGVYGR